MPKARKPRPRNKPWRPKKRRARIGRARSKAKAKVAKGKRTVRRAGTVLALVLALLWAGVSEAQDTPTPVPTSTPTATPTPTVVDPSRDISLRPGPATFALLRNATATGAGTWQKVDGYKALTVQYEVRNPCTTYTVTVQGYIGGQGVVTLLSKQQADVAQGATAAFAVTPPVRFVRGNVTAIDTCAVSLWGLGVP